MIAFALNIIFLNISGTFDFYGLNFYSAHMVTAGDDSVADDPNYWNDKATNTYADPQWLG